MVSEIFLGLKYTRMRFKVSFFWSDVVWRIKLCFLMFYDLKKFGYHSLILINGEFVQSYNRLSCICSCYWHCTRRSSFKTLFFNNVPLVIADFGRVVCDVAKLFDFDLQLLIFQLQFFFRSTTCSSGTRTSKVWKRQAQLKSRSPWPWTLRFSLQVSTKFLSLSCKVAKAYLSIYRFPFLFAVDTLRHFRVKHELHDGTRRMGVLMNLWQYISDSNYSLSVTRHDNYRRGVTNNPKWCDAIYKGCLGKCSDPKSHPVKFVYKLSNKIFLQVATLYQIHTWRRSSTIWTTTTRVTWRKAWRNMTSLQVVTPMGMPPPMKIPSLRTTKVRFGMMKYSKKIII